MPRGPEGRRGDRRWCCLHVASSRGRRFATPRGAGSCSGSDSRPGSSGRPRKAHLRRAIRGRTGAWDRPAPARRPHTGVARVRPTRSAPARPHLSPPDDITACANTQVTSTPSRRRGASWHTRPRAVRRQHRPVDRHPRGQSVKTSYKILTKKRAVYNMTKTYYFVHIYYIQLYLGLLLGCKGLLFIYTSL